MSIKGVLWIKSTLVLGKINGWSWVLLVILFDVMVISCSSNAGGLGWWFIILMCLYIYNIYIYIPLGKPLHSFSLFFAGKSTINRNHQVNYWY